MPSWFGNFAERQFKKTVKRLLIERATAKQYGPSSSALARHCTPPRYITAREHPSDAVVLR
jgi:hypothetical protein